MSVARSEQWTRDGQTAVVDVNENDAVEVAYPLLAEMLRELGFQKQEAAS